ncbi:MAG: hypothetical protein KGJ62_06815 [Armatimonadetes bacterium]|nr:hypothetical protein [Armatimonadota bacterium]MDE2206246.1 hypothetical protein [Armatimonadota bacterium]
MAAAGEAPEWRDQLWLEQRLALLCRTAFSDVADGAVVIRFGTPALRRLGSIARHGARSQIRINPLLAHPDAPEYVTDGIIAHELAHYCHGFGSALPRRYRHPHQGGVVEQELERRSLGALNAQTDLWLKNDWNAHYQRCHPAGPARAAARHDVRSSIWQAFLARPGMCAEPAIQTRLEAIAEWYGMQGFGLRTCWFHAGVRHEGISWYQPKTKTILVHGVLATPAVPACVIDEALRYWVIRRAPKTPLPAAFAAERLALEAGQARSASWLRRHWSTMLRQEHPLRGVRIVTAGRK